MIVDDHPLFLKGLASAFSFVDDIAIIGSDENGERALQRLPELQPDVILLDVNLPGMNGFQVTRAIKAVSDHFKVVILTAHHEPEQTLHAMRSGASAYTSKDVRAEHLIGIVRDVQTGYYVVNDLRMTQHEYEQWIEERLQDSTGPFIEDPEGHFLPLSPREMEILEHVTHGMINKEIAKKLGISQQTVKNHMTSILKKLNVKDRTQAALTAYRRGWVRIDNDSQQEA